MRDRGVSITVNFVLTLAITTALISGIILAAGSLVDGTQKQTTRDGYTVAGNRVIAGLQSADRLAASGADTVSLTVDLQEEVAGTQYTITINNSSTPATVTVSGVSNDQAVTLPLHTRTPVHAGTVKGGDVIVSTDATGKLTVEAKT